VQVDAAVALINRLLQPDDEEMNVHKQLQLRELAALNGTLKDETFCFICGDSGEWQCQWSGVGLEGRGCSDRGTCQMSCFALVVH
jgi:hypothetical protein